MTNKVLPLSLQVDDDFRSLFYNPKVIPINVKSNLYLHILRIENGSFVLGRLFTTMRNVLLYHVHPRNVVNEFLKNPKRAGDFVERAKEKYKSPDPKNGEGGELLLYSFLEAHLHAPKILSKMVLKTSTEHYVHGADGVHLLETSPNEYEIIFGESKMYSRLNRAIVAAFESMGTIKRNRFKLDTELAESELLKEVVDVSMLNALKSILLPSKISSPEVKRKESFGVFLGYEVDVTDYPFQDHDDAEIEEELRARAESMLEQEVDTIQREMQKRGLAGHHFHIYALPFLKENIDGKPYGIDSVRIELGKELSGKRSK